MHKPFALPQAESKHLAKVNALLEKVHHPSPRH
jgi:hypothetical protein